MEKTVYIRNVGSYDAPGLDSAVEQLLSCCGLWDRQLKGLKIILKPNLLRKAAPEQAITTHPAVVGAVIHALLAHGADDITLIDGSSGLFSGARQLDILRQSGLAGLAGEKVRLPLEDMSTDSDIAGGRIPALPLLDAITGADLVINLPKLKTHAMTCMTGAVKNLFGCIPGIQKAAIHCRYPDKDSFTDLLCELALYIKPAVTLVDAIVGMEGDGPSAGRPRELGFLAASRDPFYLDRALCHMLGIGPERALTVKKSIEKGLSPSELAGLDVEGDRGLFDSPMTDLALPRSVDTDYVKRLPGCLQGAANRLLTLVVPRPVVDPGRCIGCGRCAEICPQKTIRLENGKAFIVRSGCIRCFCCHEACPRNTIDIKRGFIWGR